jgi:hypothetical protein
MLGRKPPHMAGSRSRSTTGPTDRHSKPQEKSHIKKILQSEKRPEEEAGPLKLAAAYARWCTSILRISCRPEN